MNDASFLVLFLAITAIMAILPFALRRIGIPAVISLLLVGMLIGNTGIGVNLIPRLTDLVSFLNPPNVETSAVAKTFTDFIDMLGALGLMFLMALAGMEADFRLIKSCKRPVIALSVFTFLLPAIGGFLVYWHYQPNDLAGQLLYASLFASHSVGIVFPVMRELKLSQSRFGASVLIATVITDILSIILLAVSVQIFRQTQNISHNVINGSLSLFDSHAEFFGQHVLSVFMVIIVVYILVTLFCVHKLGRWIINKLNPGEDGTITLILLVILFVSLIGELFGVNFIVGAFIAGLGLSKVIRHQDMTLFKKFENIGYGFLIPFLFVSIGMKTDFKVFLEPNAITTALVTVAVLIGTKIGSGYIAMRLTGFKNRASMAAGLMTVPQLSATLTAAAIGKEIGIIAPQFFNAIIILSIVTTLPIPTLVRATIYGGKSKDENDNMKDQDFAVPDVVQESDLL